MGFWERSKDLLSQGVLSTKEIFEKATEKSKELGEKGVAKFEIAQLEKQAEKRFAQIGRHVYEVLVKEGQQTISDGTTEIKNLLQEVDEIEKTIDEKEEKL
jgi:heme oxygenase